MGYRTGMKMHNSSKGIISAMQQYQTQTRINRLKKEIRFLSMTRQATLQDLIEIEHITTQRLHSMQNLIEQRKQFLKSMAT